MTNHEEIKKLKVKRGSIKSKLTIFSKYLLKCKEEPNVNNINVSEFRNRLSRMENIIDEFYDVQTEIESLLDVPETEMDERESFEDLFYDIVGQATTFLETNFDVDKRSNISSSSASLIAQNNTNSNQVTSMQQQNAASNPVEHISNQNTENIISGDLHLQSVKLPTINLPSFDGSSENWLEFHDSFDSLIIQNAKIGDFQRLVYLKACLKGEALETIASIRICNDNFKIAWDLLCENYTDKRSLLHEHIKALFDIQLLQKESSVGLKQISDHITKNLRSLKNLGEPVDNWDTLIIFMVTNKLDKITRREWECMKFPNNTNKVPTLEDLLAFLKDKSNMLKKMELKFEQHCTEPKFSKLKLNSKEKYVSRSFLSNNKLCPICGKSHKIYLCAKFLQMDVNKRIESIKTLKHCINCLNANHQAEHCKFGSCKKCSSKHNTLLHLGNTISSTAIPSGSSEDSPERSLSGVIASGSQILLSTIQVTIYDSQGNPHFCRALLDSGSQSNFITTDLADIVGLERSHINMTVIGITKVSSMIKYKTETEVHSNHNAFSAKLSCLIVPHISESVPNISFDISTLRIPQNIMLADPDFNTSKPIQLLIGSDLFWQVLSIGQIKLGHSMPILQKTKFGWVIAGPLKTIQSKNISDCYFTQNIEVQDQLARFWEIEECSSNRVLSEEEKACEYSFSSTHTRDASGRFIVSLPLKESVEKLGDSMHLALKSFYKLELRLQKNDYLRELYVKFMQEYIDLGHMTPVGISSDSPITPYFLCHHGVLKEESITTKLRVVFNGSCPTTSGFSLNDLQMVGPNIQNDLFSILLRNRLFQYVASADICKMYRQVLVNPEQRFLQMIFWRSNPSDTIMSYELNTVTYGTASAAFLSVRSLHQLAFENKDTFSLASQIIMSDFYVDDLYTGSDSAQELATVCAQISSILQQGRFELRKWISNDNQVLEHVEGDMSDENFLHFDGDAPSKTLGLFWSPKTDTLLYSISPEGGGNSRITKRSILSSIAQIFDPLGLLSPCTIIAKILLQKLWLEKLTWDESVPQDLHSKWVSFRDQLHILNDLQIPRHVKCPDAVRLELHTFSDSSEEAYGACAYIRSVDNFGNITVNLLCAKSKVAPLKRITLPRLELCGALISARLSFKILESVRHTFHSIYHWSDSTIVLGWVKTPPHLLKTFVSNRVAEIQSKTNPNNWLHVSGKQNPADLLSRGCNPSILMSSHDWWHGPVFLSQTNDHWPIASSPESIELPELKSQQTSSAVSQISNDIVPINKFSSLLKLKRCFAYVLRFINNCRVPKSMRNKQPLSAKELQDALLFISKYVQKQSFPLEYSHLSQNKAIPSSSKLLRLSPFIDTQGLMRVGGRLKYSNFDFVKQHPVVLPSNHHLTILLFRDMHRKLLHAGPQQLLSTIREEFWPISGRNMARKIVHNCICCFKVKPRFEKPFMGELPKDRITVSLPFTITGVDYAGPFILKDRRSRGFKTYKIWISLYICFSTKAIHLEIVTDLTTEAFIASFRRFCARRGKPTKVLSDNAKNFLGAKSELQTLSNFLSTTERDLITLHANEGTDWKFIPPYSPHFGGLWESGIRSMKHHLKRILGKSLLIYEDFQTILLQVEAVLDSRPLFPNSSDPNDLVPITPAHFLIGRPITSLPDPDVLEINENRLSNFQRLQQLQQHIWKRWSRDYVTELQQRYKWTKNCSNIKINSLVLIKDDNSPPMSWLLGRVIATHPGLDGIIRVVTLKTSKGITKRAVTSLCPLPNEDYSVSF